MLKQKALETRVTELEDRENLLNAIKTAVSSDNFSPHDMPARLESIEKRIQIIAHKTENTIAIEELKKEICSIKEKITTYEPAWQHALGLLQKYDEEKRIKKEEE